MEVHEILMNISSFKENDDLHGFSDFVSNLTDDEKVKLIVFAQTILEYYSEFIKEYNEKKENQ